MIIVPFLKVGISIFGFSLEGTIFQYLSIIVDICLVWYLIYKLLTLIQGTKAVQLVKGVIFIFAVQLVSYFFELRTLYMIVAKVMDWGILAIIIIFQPEFRRALEQLGRGRFFARGNFYKRNDIVKVEEIVKSVEYMAKRRIGALISIERETGMEDYIETGIMMNARTTSELLINIFIPNTPLHDGAVIIRNDEIVAASCYLPLSESEFISKELGTRHRAAMGISEVTDSVTIIVSEETGGISVSKNGELHRHLTSEKLLELLKQLFRSDVTQHSSLSSWLKKVKDDE